MHTDNFTAAVLQEAFDEGSARFFLRRAEQFEAARPRIGDFHGRATPDELRRRWRELTGIAAALRAKSEFYKRNGEISEDVRNVMQEAS